MNVVTVGGLALELALWLAPVALPALVVAFLASNVPSGMVKFCDSELRSLNNAKVIQQ